MQITEYLDPRYGLLDQLYYEKKILSPEAFDKLRILRNPDECCGELLRHLLNMEDIETPLNSFKEILQKDHSWIYDTIWSDANDVSYTNNRPLSGEEKRRILFNTDCFIKLIDPCKHQFLSKLRGSDCITERQFNSLKYQFDKNNMVSELLSILERRSLIHFQSFKYWLKFTLQDNIVKVLESNGVTLEMKVYLENNDLGKPIAELLTGIVTLDDLQLNARDKTMVKTIFESLEKRKLIIVGGACGSLIVYILCLSMEAVNEIEKLYKTKELETMLNTVTILHVTIEIVDDEFTRCRRFFDESNSNHRTTGRGSNDMPSELIDKIMINPEEVAKMERKLKTVVGNLSEKLITSIDPSGYILQTLVEKGVLTSLQRTEVEAMPNSESRAEKLLSILSTTEHVETFIVFVQALKLQYDELAQMILGASDPETMGEINAVIERKKLSDRNGKFSLLLYLTKFQSCSLAGYCPDQRARDEQLFHCQSVQTIQPAS